jgi:predicted AAA+ superfamily ATPase
MDRKTALKELIQQQHTLPKSDKLFERKIELPLHSDKVIVLSGVRRCGKTVVLKLTRNRLLKNKVPIHKTLFFSFDDERLLLKTEELDLILQAYRELYPQIKLEECYFFFDEIQNIEHWEKFVRRVYDQESKNIFISGSNSKLLGSEIATSLRGRTLLYELYPLDFQEYLQFKKISPDFRNSEQRAVILSAFHDFLRQGGFPETVNRPAEQQRQILADYYQVLLFRDIVERYEVTRIYALKYFIQKLLSNLTKPFSLNKIFNDLKSQGVKVGKDNLYEILEYIEAVYLGLRLYKFDYSIVNREMSDKKIYVIDNGLLNAISFQFSDNLGKLLENAVFIWLRGVYGNNLYYHKQKAECDFVVFDRDRPILVIQVCFDMSDLDTRKRELKGLLEAMEYFNLNEGLIITAEQEETIEKNDKKIEIKAAYKLMLSNSMKCVS